MRLADVLQKATLLFLFRLSGRLVDNPEVGTWTSRLSGQVLRFRRERVSKLVQSADPGAGATYRKCDSQEVEL